MSSLSCTRSISGQGARRRPFRLLIALLAAMSLLAVSCGTDDDAADEPADTPSADTSAAVTETDDAAPEPEPEADEPAADEPAADDDAAGAAEEDEPEPEDTAPEVPAPSGTIRTAPLVSLVTMDPHSFQGGGLP